MAEAPISQGTWRGPAAAAQTLRKYLNTIACVENKVNTKEPEMGVCDVQASDNL